MKSRPCLRLCTAALAALTSCAVLKSLKSPKPEAPPATNAPKLVGRIASVPADKRFVLIQSYDHSKIEAGTILTTRGPEERTANLLATGESLGQFAAADLQSGAAQVGDAVYARHVPPPQPPPATTESSENQQQPRPEKILENN